MGSLTWGIHAKGIIEFYGNWKVKFLVHTSNGLVVREHTDTDTLTLTLTRDQFYYPGR